MKPKEVKKLLRDRRAVSTVISNIVLVGAVIAVGFTVVAWTYSRSSEYMTQYSELVNSDVDKLRERVSFEYVFYNNTAPKSLSVYLMNSGKVGSINFTTVYVSNTSWVGTFTSIQFQLRFLNGTATPNLGVGQEGYFVISSITLQPGTVYTVKAVTWRGSSFENTFVA